MKKIKKHGFSTVISLSKPKKFQILRNSSENKTHQIKSLCEQQPYVNDFEQIQIFKQSNKITLTKQNMEKIHYSLQIDNISSKKYEERLRNDSMYVEYSINPFLKEPEVKFKKRNFRQNHSRSPLKQIKPNIITALNDLKNKAEIFNVKAKFQPFQSAANYIHLQMDKNKQNLTHHRNGEKTIKIFNDIQMDNQRVILDPFEELDEIIKRKQVSHFKKKLDGKKINIFKLKYFATDEEFNSGIDQLSKYYFSQDSVIKNLQSKINIDSLKHISKQTRRLALFHPNTHKYGLKDNIISIQDMTLNIDQAGFNDLIDISGGHLDPQSLKNFIEGQNSTNNVKDQASSYLESQLEQIDYHENQLNKSTIYLQDKHEKTELVYYQKQPLNSAEKQEKRFAGQCMQKLKNILQTQKNVLNITIQDKILHQQLNKQKEKILELQFMANGIGNGLKQDIERRIRRNKIKKNRNENIKTVHLTECLKQKKEYQSQFVKKNQNKSILFSSRT